MFNNNRLLINEFLELSDATTSWKMPQKWKTKIGSSVPKVWEFRKYNSEGIREMEGNVRYCAHSALGIDFLHSGIILKSIKNKYIGQKLSVWIDV